MTMRGLGGGGSRYIANVDLDRIANRCRLFYLSSRDFNGYPVFLLKREFEIGADDSVKALLADLIRNGQVTVEFGNYHPNPHIKAFPSLESAAQLGFLEELGPSDHFCLYPSRSALVGAPEADQYRDRPYTRELALGAGQLEFRTFDLAVLEYYRNDPRYYYSSDSIHGNIGVRNAYFKSEEMAERDQILLQTFGFAYDEDMNRAVAVFLRYLTDLSPEHQRIWAARELHSKYSLHPDYHRTSVIGDWGERISVFDAFVGELKVINEMCGLMSRPNLFRDEYAEKPDGFEFLLRPTSKELRDFCLLLDKMMSQNINVGFFRAEVPTEGEQERPDGKIVVRQRGSISIFESWLRKKFRTPDSEALDEIFETFKFVRKLRQKPAHKIDDNAFNQEFFSEQRHLMMRAYGALRNIRLIFANHPAVRSRPPEIFPELRDGKIWVF
jgi:hypothetical protein